MAPAGARFRVWLRFLAISEWRSTGFGQLARPVGDFIKPIRNRAESVELHFWETTTWQSKLASERRMERKQMQPKDFHR